MPGVQPDALPRRHVVDAEVSCVVGHREDRVIDDDDLGASTGRRERATEGTHAAAIEREVLMLPLGQSAQEGRVAQRGQEGVGAVIHHAQGVAAYGHQQTRREPTVVDVHLLHRRRPRRQRAFEGVGVAGGGDHDTREQTLGRSLHGLAIGLQRRGTGVGERGLTRAATELFGCVMRQARSVGQTHHALDHAERARGLGNIGAVGASVRHGCTRAAPAARQARETGEEEQGGPHAHAHPQERKPCAASTAMRR